MLFHCAASRNGAAVRDGRGPDSGGRGHVQKRRPDKFFKTGRRRAGVPDFDFDSAHVLDYPGDSVGVHLACRALPDGWASPRYSSGYVPAGAGVDWIAGTGTGEVWLSANTFPTLEILS